MRPLLSISLIAVLISGCQTNPKRVPDLHYGMTYEAVDDAIWGEDEHQFSADVDGAVYDCFYVEFGRERARAWYYIVFENGKFLSTVGIMQFFEWEVIDHGNSKSERQAPWDPEDRMRRIIAAEPIPLDQLKTEVATKLDERRKSRSFHSNLGPAIPFLLPIVAGIAIREVPKTVQIVHWRNHFDSERVRLGLTREEVDRIFGPPVFTIPGSSGETCAYGPRESLEQLRGQVRLLPSDGDYWVAVVFEDGTVSRVFSSYLFDHEDIARNEYFVAE